MPNFSLLLVILCIVNNCQCVLGFVVPQHRIIPINISPRSSLQYTQCQHHFNHHRHQQQLKQRQNSLVLQGKLLGSCLYSNADNSEEPSENDGYDPVIRDVAVRLRRVNWISWWSQVILTVISSITLLFARSVLNAVSGAVVSPTGSAVPPSTAPGGFVFAGSGKAFRLFRIFQFFYNAYVFNKYMTHVHIFYIYIYLFSHKSLQELYYPTCL